MPEPQGGETSRARDAHPTRSLADALAFSSGIASAVAGCLVLAAARALGQPPPLDAAGLAAAGTLCVYNIDRLRDVAADRTKAPLRTAFVESYRFELQLATGVGALACALISPLLPWSAWMLCAGALGLGLLHRRLKRSALWKPLYVGLAWVIVTIGLPVSVAPAPGPEPSRIAWVTAVAASALAANLLASTLRERFRPRILAAARALAALGVAAGATAPAEVMPLVAVPLLELLALIRFQTSERYALLVLDGALLAGALAALLLLGA